MMEGISEYHSGPISHSIAKILIGSVIKSQPADSLVTNLKTTINFFSNVVYSPFDNGYSAFHEIDVFLAVGKF